jgi:hypothetical protein
MCCILCSVAVLGQNENYSSETLSQKYSEQTKIISQAFKDKNYKQAKSLLNELIDFFSALPESELKKHSSALPNLYYDLTCVHSLEKNTKMAISSFEKAVGLGYINYSHANKDTDLDNIRNDKRFKELMSSIREHGDYLYIIQQAVKYQKEDTTGYPKFVYEDIGNWRIQNVKKYLKLDSIAGNGDEISKIINIMTWVHNTIPHDGSHFPNCEIDAVDIYNYSKANNNKGVNCRALAIVLNECYLSMGFKSRYITCLPKNENDSDCHVINSVYSKTLNKWLWMDPTFNAYLKDEKGTLLGIAEVRDILINNQTIILNEDANWNNKNPQTKENYIDSYMAKNLYWLQCPARSIFNVETNYRNTNEKYLSLLPLGFEREDKWKNNMITHDDAYFWQAPEFKD